MALSEIDRDLVDRCLSHQPQAWEDFVDRYMGLVIHVINHTAACRSIRLSADDRDDLAAEVLLQFVKDDFAVLRNFRRKSSLATYLTVIARRVVVDQLLRSRRSTPLSASGPDENAVDPQQDRVDDREEVEQLLQQLDGAEADVVRMYHLEGKSYQEISASVGMPENSVGPVLSRARTKMRQLRADQPAGS